MDLTSFTNSKKTDKKTIVKTKDVSIEKVGDKEIVFNIKNKKELEKYENYLFFAPTNAIKPKSKEEMEKYFEKSISDGVEGVMVKNLEAQYKPGSRTGAMAKLKETKEDLDVVILAAEYGTGKRSGYYSSFIVGILNDSEYLDETYLEIGKVSSGIKELEGEGVSLAKITEMLKPLKIKENKNRVYFKPKIIIQVRYQEIQKSSIYASGYALRFPRIIMLREDKNLDEINSLSDVLRLS
jgi:DNA ligase-1